MKLLVLWSACIMSCTPATSTSSETPASENTPSNGSCFDPYVGKLDELLTKAEIQSVYPSVDDHAEYEYSRIGSIDYQVCQYQWDSDRTYMMKVGAQEISVAKPNKIGIGCLRTYRDKIEDPLEYFKNAHRTPTKEELAQFQEMTKKKMEEEGMSEAEQKTGEAITTPFLAKISFTAIEGLGDAAAWDHMDSALAILVGRVEFKIYVEVSADEEENQELAKKLAKIVLAKC